MRLLLVEDDQSDRQGFMQSVDRYNHENGSAITVDYCDTLMAALSRLDEGFDGAVIDMKLGGEGGEGNEILKALDEKNIRMPIVILTGTPSEADYAYVHIEVQKKGEADNLEILEDFRQIHASGLTKVMGGRGLLEELLSHVYKKNMLSQKEIWKRYGRIDAAKSEKALVRHVMNHLVHIVDIDEDSCVPEEFYIFPPFDNNFRTGSVVQSKADETFFAILTPLCDLTDRGGGEFNARKIMLCKISSLDECVAELPENKRNSRGRKALKESLNANKKGCYHALPGTVFFPGGYLDFENLISISKGQFDEQYERPTLQIAPAFTKDIVARFSSFFGRQGQPTVTHPED